MSIIKDIVPKHYIPAIAEVQECYQYLKARNGSIAFTPLGSFEMKFRFAVIMRSAIEVYKEGEVYWEILSRPNLQGLPK